MNPPTTFAASSLVAIGGGAGAVLRFHFGRWVVHLLGPTAATAFPWATLGVNFLGSLAMGLLAGWLVRYGGSEAWRLLLGVGVLGGFTTFSAFSLELVLLAERGAWAAALVYATVSLGAGAAALFLGLVVMRA